MQPPLRSGTVWIPSSGLFPPDAVWINRYVLDPPDADPVAELGHRRCDDRAAVSSGQHYGSRFLRERKDHSRRVYRVRILQQPSDLAGPLTGTRDLGDEQSGHLSGQAPLHNER